MPARSCIASVVIVAGPVPMAGCRMAGSRSCGTVTFAGVAPNPMLTREKLIAAAEQLFAERSIDGVSLRQINSAAGQRNSTALQYHFGGRSGLIRAVLDKHRGGDRDPAPPLLDEYEATADGDLRLLAGRGRPAAGRRALRSRRGPGLPADHGPAREPARSARTRSGDHRPDRQHLPLAPAGGDADARGGCPAPAPALGRPAHHLRRAGPPGRGATGPRRPAVHELPDRPRHLGAVHHPVARDPRAARRIQPSPRRSLSGSALGSRPPRPVACGAAIDRVESSVTPPPRRPRRHHDARRPPRRPCRTATPSPKATTDPRPGLTPGRARARPHPGSPTSGLRPELLATLTRLGYEEPTPIQRETIPILLEGRDLLGQAATGTGKTAAFALPILERIPPDGRPHRARRPGPGADPRAGRAGVRGDLPLRARPRRPGAADLRRPADRPPAPGPAPGRARRRGHARAGPSTTSAAARCRSTPCEVVVLDEADEMLDMGFAEDIEAILEATPDDRQTVLFSATMPPRIDRIIRRHLQRPGPHPDRPGQHRVGRRRRSSARAPTWWPGPTSRPRSARVLDVEAPTLGHRLLPHPHRGRPGHRDAQRSRLPGRGAARRHEPGAARPGHGPAAQPAPPTCSSPPTWPPAASTSTSSPTSSTTTCRRPPSPTCTASAGSGGPGREGVAITLAEPREQRLLGNIERLTKQKIADREGADGRRPAGPPDGADPRRRCARPSTATTSTTFRSMVETLAERVRPAPTSPSPR